MWRTLIVVQLALVLVGLQVADAPAHRSKDNGPGCGLAKMVWADYKRQKQIEPQVMMSSTNQLGSQSLAIASGTWGCTNNGTMTAERKVHTFAALTSENLSRDMAQGHGEHLTSLATLMGIPKEYQAEFFALTQENYTTLIQSGETTPAAMLISLHDAMAVHPILAQLSTTP